MNNSQVSGVFWVSSFSTVFLFERKCYVVKRKRHFFVNLISSFTMLFYHYGSATRDNFYKYGKYLLQKFFQV